MPPPSNNSAVIVERIEALRCDVVELTNTTRALADDYRRFREFYTGEHTKVTMQAEAAHRRLDEHDQKIGDLQKAVAGISLQMANTDRTLKLLTAVLGFLAVTIGGLAIGYFWALLVK